MLVLLTRPTKRLFKLMQRSSRQDFESMSAIFFFFLEVTCFTGAKGALLKTYHGPNSSDLRNRCADQPSHHDSRASKSKKKKTSEEHS